MIRTNQLIMFYMSSSMTGKNILVTGPNGMLGEELANHFKSRGYNVYDKYFDITIKQNWKELLSKNEFNIILHAAAITDVDFCELNKSSSLEVNFNFLKKILPLIKNQKFIFFSSTGVYGNSKKKDPYAEEDLVEPTTFYHQTKLNAENYISSNLNNSLILRLGWLYGGSKNKKRNFVNRIYEEAKLNDLIYSDSKIFGSPTSVQEVAKQVEKLIDNSTVGIYNCVNESESLISRKIFVEKILEFLGLKNEVVAAPKDYFKRKANIPVNESAENLGLSKIGLNIMSKWDISLKNYIKTF